VVAKGRGVAAVVTLSRREVAKRGPEREAWLGATQNAVAAGTSAQRDTTAAARKRRRGKETVGGANVSGGRVGIMFLKRPDGHKECLVV